MNFSMGPWLMRSLTLVVVGGMGMACQSTTSPASDSSAATTDTPGTSDSAIAEDSASTVSSYDLKDVCNGIPMAGAAAYDSSIAGIHPLLVFSRESDSESFYETTVYTPDAWTVSWEEAAKVELVACLTVTDRALAKVCEFEGDEAEGESDVYTLELQNTVYQADLYEAQTGKLLETQTFDTKASDTCPMLHMFSNGETVDQSDAGYEQPLIEFAKPYVQPAT